MMNKEKLFFEKKTIGEFFFSSNYFVEVYDKIIADGKQSYLDFSVVYDENKKFLIDKLGKQHFCSMDSSCRRLYVWKRQLETGNYWIITGGNGRGTTYEVDSDVNLNAVMNDIMGVYDILHLLPIVEPFDLGRLK